MEISLATAVKLLQDADTLVVTGHIHPDGDCLGSMLALYEYLSSSGKQVQLLLDDDVPALYSFLPGSEKIGRPENRTITADLLVVVDASDAERIANVKNLVSAKILNLDHHISNTKFADYYYIDTTAAATGEIILAILRQVNTVITSTMAVNLFTAIATDCGFFRYANTTSVTLREAAALVDAGAQPHIISEYLETKPLESILTLKKILDTLELHADGQIAAITVAPDSNDNGNDNGNTEGMINYPRNIEGVEIAIMFKPGDDDTTRVSLRSRAVDVSRLAVSFGGGGHARAAGCSVNAPMSQAKEKVFQAATDLLLELGI
ncbi:MAG: bifunctional oligoribonuclease/PAP phosphatase NrnA [Negativicutes bacterium]|nr:bifunctional oligoribonuclease/PAP phosphatase NrnA [Negativicutes bacterium]